MPRKYTRKKKQPTIIQYEVIEKIKADILDHVIIAKKGEIIELSQFEATVLKNYIKEKE